jgi:surface polysaccharide O-acyltransferase-like enzyme
LSREGARTLGIISLGLLLGCSFNRYLWFITPMLWITTNVLFIKSLHAEKHRLLAWIGTISPFIYILHPSTREFFIIFARSTHSYSVLACYIVATIVCSWILSIVVNRVSESIEKVVGKIMG